MNRFLLAFLGLTMVACAPEGADLMVDDDSWSDQARDDDSDSDSDSDSDDGRRLTEGEWLSTIDDASAGTCGTVGSFIVPSPYELVWTHGKTFETIGDSGTNFECETGPRKTFECSEWTFSSVLYPGLATLHFSAFPEGEILSQDQYLTQSVTTVECEGAFCPLFAGAFSTSFPCELTVETTNNLTLAY